MDFLLVYFSGTGNTKLITEEVGKRLVQQGHAVELLSIEDRGELKKADFTGKIIGFGFPVYKLTTPDIFQDLFALFNQKASHNPCFLYCTYARFMADSFYDFNRQLDREKYRLIAAQGFKSPSNGISARLSPEDYEYQTVMFFEDGIAEKLDRFVEEILQNLQKSADFRIQHTQALIGPLRAKITVDVEKTKYPRLQIDAERCTVCGLCAAQCPVGNLVKQEESIQIVDAEDCLHCLRCMHHCPQNAISFGSLTRGENRYTLKTRNQLFEKSASGFQEKYWANFEAVSRKWRKNTVKYWLMHRGKPEF